MMYYLKFLSREGTIIRGGESSYLANALTIIRKRIFKSQISNLAFIRSLRSLRTVGTVGTFFYYLNEVLSREKHQLAVICVVIDWSNKSNGVDRTDR